MTTNVQRIPPSVNHEMQQYDQWICWTLRRNPETGKDDKIPCDTLGHSISVMDRTQWMSYEQASSTQYPVGFVFTPDDPFVFIDLDDCIDSHGPNEFARGVMGWFPGAFQERSVSRRGLHLFLKGSEAIIGKHKTKSAQYPGLEVYTQGRFCAINGVGTSGEMLDFSDRLEQFVTAFGLETATDLPVLDAQAARENYTGPANDLDLIRLMLNSGGSAGQAFGDKCHIRDLWSGDAQVIAKHFPPNGPDRAWDYSAADMALMNHLAFWTGCEPQRMLNLFSMSAIYRGDKYAKRPDLLKRLVTKAVGGCTKVYDRDAQQAEMPANGPVSWSQLADATFPPVTYLIPNFMSDGVSLLGAKPKLGKSMIAVNLACAVLAGGPFLGVQADSGGVWYFGLEDTKRRLQARFKSVMQLNNMRADAKWPLQLWDTLSGINNTNIIQTLDVYRDLFGLPRLIVIDTIEQVRPYDSKITNAYKLDRMALDPLTQWTAAHPGVAILVICHNRKDQTSDDPFDDFSGSTGLSAAVDNLICAREVRDDTGKVKYASMYYRGREVEENNMVIERIGDLWTTHGDADEFMRRTVREKIIDILKASPQGAFPKEIIDEGDIVKRSFFRAIKKLTADGIVEKSGSKYKLTPFHDSNAPSVS